MKCIQLGSIFLMVVLVAIACSTSVGKTENSQPEKAHITYKDSIIFVGKVALNTGYNDSIKIKNIGQAKCIIEELETSCLCTNAKTSKDTLKIGDSAFIYYTVKPNVTGYFQQSISVVSNNDKNPLIFFIRGIVE